MNEIYELNFHGNRQEIENEKQRKRELMSHFPKILGTVDETRYVLHDDEKQKQTDYFESKPVSPLTVAPAKDEPLFNIRGIGEQQSEKPKKDVSMQTAVQGIAKFGNKETSFGLGNWKSASTLFSLQKEKNETKVPESPFDFNGNTAKEEGNPFQFHGLGTATGSKPRTTTVKNDSWRLEGRKIESVADTVWNTNSSLGLDKNNQPPTAKTRLYVHGKPRTKDYAVQIDTLIGNLPVAASNILKQLGVGIDIVDNLYTTTDKGEYKKRNGIYLGQNNRIVIDSKHVDEYTLISEVFHAAQDQLEMTGTGKSNLEFQEHVIKDLYFGQKFRKTGDYKYFKGLSATDDEGYANFINNGFDNNGNLYLNNFLMHINSYFDKFQEYYSGSGAYQEPGVDNFSYNWKVILELFGIKYK